jgi:5-hydroxyisourate hydrolase
MAIFTQVFDGTYGRFATGIRAYLCRRNGAGWTTIAEAATNADGQISDWDGSRLEYGLYQIVFHSDSYFATLGEQCAYSEVIVTLRMQSDAARFQVHLTLSPYSYSVYIGTAGDGP